MRVALVVALCGVLVLPSGVVFGSPRVLPLAEDSMRAKPHFEVLGSSDAGVTLRFHLPALEVEELEVEGRTFHLVGIPDGGLDGDIGRPSVPFFSRLVSIPDRSGVRLRVVDSTAERLEGYDLLPMQPDPEYEEVEGFVIDEAYYQMEVLEERPLAKMGAPVILRDLRVVPLTIQPVRYLPTEHALEVTRQVTVEIEFVGEDLRNAKEATRDLIPSSFHRMYNALVVNYQGPREGQRIGNGKYLIICPNNSTVITNLQALVDWRTQMGYPTELATTAQTGTTNASIKNYIQGVYDTETLEHVCLVGDATGTISLPTWTETTHNGDGDHPYTKLEGGDILSDIHIGRLSVDTTTKLLYVVNKIVTYEVNPVMADTEWFKSACLIGDPSTSGETCVYVMEWIKARLEQLGYVDIDEWYSNSAATFFQTSMADGVGLCCYRGYLGMSGIDNSTIEAADPNGMLPFAVTLTCGTGSFADEYSRSEAFLRAGSTGDVRGGVGAIGSATWSTHTKYNNVMMQGIMNGLLYDGLPELGACLTRGKLEMYLHFYDNDPSYAEIYAYWNNLMGDPATRCWTEVPRDKPAVTNPGMIPIGTTSVPVWVEDPYTHEPLEGVCVALYKEDETQVSGFTDENGEIELGVNTPTTGVMKIVVHEWNRSPHTRDITVSDVADNVALNGYQIDDDTSGSSDGNSNAEANPGETLEIPVQLKNWGSSTATTVTAVMSSDDPYVTVSDDSETFANISVDGTVWSGDDFDVVIDGGCPHGYSIPLGVDITSDQGSWNALLELPVVSVEFKYSSHTWYDVGGQLDPGETGEVSIAVTNIGGMSGLGVTGLLVSLSNYLTVTDPNGTYGTIGLGSTVGNTTDRFGVSASAAAYPGHLATCLLVLETTSGARDTLVVGLRIGTASSTDPVGPDGYGYYAFDNTDTDYPDAPTYGWFEIAGNYGGPGTDVGLNDNGFEQDQHVFVDLPFTFSFYGENFDEITVCSNGWIAMGHQNNNQCWNTTIPGAGGPNGMIAPFWDDLYQSGGAEVWKYHDSANHRFILEWSRLYNEYSNSIETFQAILYDPFYTPTATGDGEIVFMYETVANNDASKAYATVGIENLEHNDGVLYTFWNDYSSGAATLTSGRAIKFVPIVASAMGYITGEVTNLTAGGTPVEGAEIRLLESGRALYTTTDGSYFGAIPVDTCTVVVSHASFTSDTTYAVVITEDDTATVDFGIYDIAGPEITGTTQYGMTNDTTGPYDIYSRVFDYSGLEEKAFYYRTNSGEFQPLTMVPQGNDNYLMQIPGQPYNTRVDYYAYAKDVTDLETQDPPGAPGDTTYGFWVIPIDVVFEDDMESSGGWSVSSTASTGQWERVDPNAIWSGSDEVQPEDDHTPSPGTQCYITGQSDPGASQGTNDVDGGYTRLTSPTIDLSGYHSATLSYYRWYSNDTGNAPGEDFWQVDINDGTGWESLENTNASDRSWLYREFDLTEYINLTSQVQLRFTAEDASSGSVVEAGVDDVYLAAYSIPNDVEPPSVSVLEPNGGEQIVGGGSTPFTIRWDAEDNFGITTTKILLSTDGGATYPDTIASGAYDSTYAWDVPDLDESDCRIKIVCYDGASNEGLDISDSDFEIISVTAAGLAALDLPREVSLEQNRPNPFNPVTQVRFGLPKPMTVSLRVYSVEGRLVQTLAEGAYEAGYHTAAWAGEGRNGAEASSGIYFYRLETPEKVLTRKMIMLK